tara:strand:- start:451 stop:681 length:231 start_codon:yes stop_codon:yes gene_type:complete
MSFNIKENWKTTLSVIITILTSLYQVFVDNAEYLGIDNKYVMIASIIITAITAIFNGIKNGTGDTKMERVLSYIKF